MCVCMDVKQLGARTLIRITNLTRLRVSAFCTSLLFCLCFCFCFCSTSFFFFVFALFAFSFLLRLQLDFFFFLFVWKINKINYINK